MKNVGIIGGMSYESTMHYYEEINEKINKKMGNLIFPEMIVCSVNFDEYRTLMIAGDWREIGRKLTNIASILEQVGCDYIAIATNTMHKVADIVQKNINVPVIHIIDATALKCKEKGVKNPLLLGTKISMTESFIFSKYKENGVELFTPKAAQIHTIDDIIFNELCKGIITSPSRDYVIDVIESCVKENPDIDGVILGCTELDMLIKEKDLKIPLIDTTEAHIDAIVKCLTMK